MIYTFGSSLTKYHWPTWADWLEVYQGPVTNLAYTGYDISKVYWTIVDHLKHINKDDQIYIMWPGNTTTTVWYDNNWIEDNDCREFFPNPEGKLWFTQNIPWQGLYKQHPQHLASFTHLLTQNIQCILYSQMLLEKVGCKYTMLFNVNPWIDIRPTYGEKYTTIWNKIIHVGPDDVAKAKDILNISPIRQIFKLIKWEHVIGVPDNLETLEEYKGIWEYEFSNKEYILLKNPSDMHPSSLAHHDYLLKKLLNLDPKHGIYRDNALEISKEWINKDPPSFKIEDFTATPNMKIMNYDLKSLKEKSLDN